MFGKHYIRRNKAVMINFNQHFSLDVNIQGLNWLTDRQCVHAPWGPITKQSVNDIISYFNGAVI